MTLTKQAMRQFGRAYLARQKRWLLNRLVFAYLKTKTRQSESSELETVEGNYSCVILTRAGRLKVSLLKVESDHESVFCKFEDPERAARAVGPDPNRLLNRHSGKWNHHYYGWPAHEAFADFVRHLEPLLYDADKLASGKKARKP